MSCLRRIQILVENVCQSFTKSWLVRSDWVRGASDTQVAVDLSKISHCSNFWRKIARNLTFRFEKKLGQPLEMSCLRRTEILVEIVFQSYKKSWSEVLGTKWQTCIQNLPGPKQRFLVISQNWCGDFPPNLVITLNLLSSPQIQIFIEMWSISAKKSIDSLLGLWASKISDSYSASTALFGDFSKLVRRFSTKFGDHVKIALFTTNPNFYWNSSVISEEIHWSTFLDSGEQWICPKSLIIRIFDER